MPRGGVIRDPTVHRKVLRAFGDAAMGTGFVPHMVIRSPIEGGDGNVEFLALLEHRGERENGLGQAWIDAVDALLGASRA